MSRSLKSVDREIKANDPPIEIGQVWVSKLNRKVYRRLGIVARFAEDHERFPGRWIAEELPGGRMKLDLYRLLPIPEFNLRYVFRPEVKK